jgi:hypothetical protein
MKGINPILEQLGMTTRDLILNVVSAMFFLDFGVVKAVSADKKKVDVRHSIIQSVAGQPLPETVSIGIEVLWPGGGMQYSEQMDIAVGDPVLLIGLKDFVRSSGSAAPASTGVPLHYTQETMKAIPLGTYNSSATVRLLVTGGKWQLTAVEIDLNGSSKAFITDALQGVLNTFTTALQAALAAATPNVACAVPSIDLTAAKTTTVKTGG